jgi:cytochrome c peroxidase
MRSTSQQLVNTGAVVLFLCLAMRAASGEESSVTLLHFANDLGTSETVAVTPRFDTTNAFFQSLGTNDRACITCHQPGDGWSVTPTSLRRRFQDSDGFDPIFRLNDGANCPIADVSTLDGRQDAYGLLLTKGLIRVALPIPAGAEFSLIDVDDPYDCDPRGDLALFRRPLPTTNLKFLSGVMWDGRESPAGRSMDDNLRRQVIDATLGHAEASVAPTVDQIEEIVAFEKALFTAQVRDRFARDLDGDGVAGGAVALSTQPFFLGINDPIGMNPAGTPFDPHAITVFDGWLRRRGNGDPAQGARRAIARGQDLFNTRPIAISGVGGLNDVLNAPVIAGTCTTCHDTPNVGNHSVSMPLNIGIADEANRPADLPLYTLSCIKTGEIIRTTDPGRAMVTGKCADIGKFKGPILRALAARAPYFHNGSAATAGEVVEFYDRRFALRLTAREKADLVAFLGAL